jgi:hypothetical protein
MTDTYGDVRQVVRDWVATERGTTVNRMKVMRSAYASTATLLNVHLKLADGERLRVVYKASRGVKPEIIRDPGREPWMYESVLALNAVAGAPRLLSSGPVRDGGRWLLMEWVGSVDLTQVGECAVWCAAAAQLARIHVWGESRVGDLLRGTPVRWDDPMLHIWWADRARRSPAKRGPRLSATDDLLAPLWARYRVVGDRLAAMPKTLVHGDLNASNVLVTRTAAGKRIRIIDWETAGIGPGLIDLASLLSGRLPQGHQAGMVAAYRAELGGSFLGSLSTQEFDEALRWCGLALAVKWLGWSPGWAPPRAHAYDWRAEALMLAHGLGLLDHD